MEVISHSLAFTCKDRKTKYKEIQKSVMADHILEEVQIIYMADRK